MLIIGQGIIEIGYKKKVTFICQFISFEKIYLTKAFIADTFFCEKDFANVGFM